MWVNNQGFPYRFTYKSKVFFNLTLRVEIIRI